MTTEHYLRVAGDILTKAKILAKQYHELGRPLGITGEVAEYEAIRLLSLEVSPARQAGYDAIRKSPDGEEKIQIKGRVIQNNSKKDQRVGAIKLNNGWDIILLVMLDSDFNPTEIYEANRANIEKALLAPNSKARNERRQLGTTKFKSISGRPIWSKQPSLV